MNQNKKSSQSFEHQNKTVPINFINKAINAFLWIGFICNIGFLVLNFNERLDWGFWGLFRINRFTILIWTMVSFFSAIIGSYSTTYLGGFNYRGRFTGLCLGFTTSVIVFVASDHVLPLLLSWFLMGFFMARLIGVDSNWGEAKEASKYAKKYFLTGSLFLNVGVLLLAFYCGRFTVSGISTALNSIPQYILLLSALFIITAAIIQSAIYPFHRWLLSAMTAPTPASALMHAGFVNGSGILLTLFASLLFAAQMLTLLFIIGGLTAITAQFTKLLQTNIKQKLACSTIAQMGFMIMQCGLGFFNAAVTHLILHGFYKAYLFLSSGEYIEASIPNKPLSIQIKPLQAVVVLLFGILGAVFFALLTGKGTSLDSGIFLTLIVATTVGQATYNVVKQNTLTTWQKTFLPFVLFFLGIGCYAFIYKIVTVLMADMSKVEVPLSLSIIQIVFYSLFLTGFFIMKLSIYKRVPWLYVKLLNLSQPYKKTVLMFKNNSL